MESILLMQILNMFLCFMTYIADLVLFIGLITVTLGILTILHSILARLESMLIIIEHQHQQLGVPMLHS